MKKILAPLILLFGVIFFAAGLTYLQVDNQTALFSAFVGAAMIWYAFYLFRQTRRNKNKNSRDDILDKVRERVASQYVRDDDNDDVKRDERKD